MRYSLVILRVERSFGIPEDYQPASIEFWTRRGFRMKQYPTGALEGRRGNLLGDLFSFNMSHPRATLRICQSEQGELQCTIVIPSLGHKPTDWNVAWWNLELILFGEFLRTKDHGAERFEGFRLLHRRASWAWFLSGGKQGQTIPPEVDL